MLAFLNQYSIQQRLLAVVALGCVGLLCASLPRALSAYKQMTTAKSTIEQIDLAAAASALVHEMQRERGNSAGYLGSKGSAQFRAKIASQHIMTDAAFKRFQTSFMTADLHPASVTAAGDIRAALDLLSSERSKVLVQTSSVAQMAGYYTATIGSLLELFSSVVKSTDNSALVADGSAVLAFLQAKERAGIERAMGAAGFGAGQFSPALARKFTDLIAAQNAFFEIFLDLTKPQSAAAYKAIMSGTQAQAVQDLRDIALASFVSGDIQGIKGPKWFDTITLKIDQFYGLETTLMEQLVFSARGAQSAATRALILAGIITLGFIAALIWASMVLGRSITKPVEEMIGQTAQIAGGDLTHSFAYTQARSEIGEFACSLDALQARLLEASAERKETRARDAEAKAKDEAQRAADTERAEQERTKAIENAKAQRAAVTGALESMAEKVKASLSATLGDALSAMDQAKSCSDNLKDVSDTVSTNVSDAQSSAMAATDASQAVAAASEELNASINEINAQVEASKTIVEATTQEAQTVSQSLSSLSDATNEIAEVITIITEIAEQTNLLALNATIEAARARDAGKGFAVVASEVKSLADQTAKSSGTIRGQVTNVQSAVQTAVDQIKHMTERMEEVSERSDTVYQSVGQQSAATGEIAQSVQSASVSVDEVFHKISDISSDTATLNDVGANLVTIVSGIQTSIDTLQTNVLEVLDETTYSAGSDATKAA